MTSTHKPAKLTKLRCQTGAERLMNRVNPAVAIALFAAALLVGCGESNRVHRPLLRVATTTSTRDSGLTDVLIPMFENQHNVQVKLIAVGTGKALRLGEQGEVDVILVHSEKDELDFIQAGHGTRREKVMFNYFEILGPESDPAKIKGQNPVNAMLNIRNSGSTFVSRGDNSGTHKRELELWQRANQNPPWKNYLETGQGMGASLIIADQKRGYILCDQGTYLAMKGEIDLVPLAKQTDVMRNPYGVLCVNPEKNSLIQSELAQRFVDFLITPAAQTTIQKYNINEEVLFFPVHETN